MNSSPSPTLTGLPSEIRLLVYSFIGRASGRLDFEIRPDFVTATRPSSTTQSLASLSQTCKTIHSELSDFLYQSIRPFVSITNRPVYRRDYRYSRELSPGLTYLRCLRSISLQLTLDAGQGVAMQRRTVEWLEDVLTVLSLSDELEELRFQVVVVPSGSLRGKAWVAEQAERIKKVSDEDGERIGRSQKEREVDYAWRLLPLLRTADVGAS